MANSPVAQYVLDVANAKVYPLLAGSSLGAQEGADVGTGGSPASAETPNTATFINNRTIEFHNYSFALMADLTNTSSGVYRKDEGGTGQWGRVNGGALNLSQDGAVTGLHVLHPNGVPTLAYISQNNSITGRLHTTIDGITGSNWGTNAGLNIEANSVANESDHGQSIKYRNSIFWCHEQRTGAAGAGSVTSYDLSTGLLTRYNPNIVGNACTRALHVHNDKVFLLAHLNSGNDPSELYRLDGGVFTAVYQPVYYYTPEFGHHAMWTDHASGDLVMFIIGGNNIGSVKDAAIRHIVNAETGSGLSAPDISGTVMGAVNVGAGKYRATGSNQHNSRRSSVYVDTQTDPANPRTYITTWVPGGNTECWEWKGLLAPMELVGGGAGISDLLALPYNTTGGGQHSPATSRVTMFSPGEASGGSQIGFRLTKTDTAKTLTFRGSDTHGAPDTIVPIVPSSLVIGAGMMTGLTAYYHLNGDVVDASGQGNNQADVGAVPFVTGKFGDGANMENNTDRFQVAVADWNHLGENGGAWSISMWINPTTLTGGLALATNNFTNGWALFLTGAGALQVYQGATLATTPDAILATGSFQHLMLVSGGTVAAGGTGSLGVYVDNVLVDTMAALSQPSPGGQFVIGTGVSGASPYVGVIDEFAMWKNRALTAAERGYVYNSGAGFLLEGPTPFALAPTISGNTIINLVPDEALTPFSVVLDTGAAGVDIAEGDTGLLIAELS